MRIRWTPSAVADMQSISDYLKEHHPQYREATLRKLYEQIRALKDTPYRGRPGRAMISRQAFGFRNFENDRKRVKVLCG